VTFAILAHERPISALWSVAQATVARDAELVANEFEWGHTVYDRPAISQGGWTIVGHVLRDPWGINPERCEPDRVVAALTTYGPAAMGMFAGPWLAIDESAGRMYGAHNGIVKVWQASDVAGTTPSAVQSLAKSRPQLPPVSWPVVADRVPNASMSGLMNEVESRLPSLGATIAEDGELSARLVTGTNTAIAFVQTCLIDEIETWRHADVSRLRFQVERLGFTLLVPFLERPFVDSLGFVVT
jgi:hypothetical protein